MHASTLFSKTLAFLESIGSWFLPQHCFLCRSPSPLLLCRPCLKDLPYHLPNPYICTRCGQFLSDNVCSHCRSDPPTFHRLQTLFKYEHPIDQLIHAAKYQRNLGILKLLAQLMACRFSIHHYPEVLIPVPLHLSRLRERGYNQSLELAKILSQYTGIPVDYRVVSRTKNTKPQVALSYQDRLNNLKEAFEITRTSLNWQHIILIDDVLTTGTTLNELTQIFLNAKVSTVEVWCCARTVDLENKFTNKKKHLSESIP